MLFFNVIIMLKKIKMSSEAHVELVAFVAVVFKDASLSKSNECVNPFEMPKHSIGCERGSLPFFNFLLEK